MGIDITLVFLGIFAFFIVICFLAGLIRGMSRQIFSIILVLACFGLIFAFEGTITDYIMHLDVGGQTVKEAITASLAQDPSMEGLVGKLVPLVEILVGIVAFVVGFIALYILSRIIFFIGKFFIHPNKKRRLLGALLGVVQGCIIAFIICVPVSGVLAEVNKLSQIEVEGQQVFSLDAIGYDEYESSPINEILTKFGGGLFKEISKTTTDDGKTITLTGQVDSVITVIKIADTVSKIPEVDLNEGLNKENVQGITDILRDLDDIKEESSEEVLDTIDSLIESAVDMLGEEVAGEISIDLSEISIKEIDFENEAVLVETVLEIVEAESFEAVEDEDLDKLVETFADSKLVLPIVEASGLDITLPDDVAEKITESIEKLDDPEQINRLKELFNLYAGA